MPLLMDPPYPSISPYLSPPQYHNIFMLWIRPSTIKFNIIQYIVIWCGVVVPLTATINFKLFLLCTIYYVNRLSNIKEKWQNLWIEPPTMGCITNVPNCQAIGWLVVWFIVPIPFEVVPNSAFGILRPFGTPFSMRRG